MSAPMTTLPIGATNTAPEGQDGIAMAPKDTVIDGFVAARDLESDATGLTFATAPKGGPSSGTVTVRADGTYRYTPNTGFEGSDSFQVTVTDAGGLTDTVTVSVSVGGSIETGTPTSDALTIGRPGASSQQLIDPPSGTSGNRKTWTFSTWVKFSGDGSGSLFRNPVTWSPISGIHRTSAGKLYIFDFYGNREGYKVPYTYLVSRDEVIAENDRWHHVTVSYNSDPAVGPVEVVAWVNGQQIMNWGGGTPADRPSSDQVNPHFTSWINLGSYPHAVGYELQSEAAFADTYFVDGQALTAESFAREVQGTWTAVSYDGSMTGQSFHLDYSDPTDFGRDVSGNGRDFTATGFSAADQTTGMPRLPAPVSLPGGSGADVLIGGDGSDTASGAAGSDSLAGGLGDDSLDGGDGSDSLAGGDGSDTLAGGTGADSLDGGAGSDVAVMAGALADFLVEIRGDGALVVHNQADGVADLVRDVETVRFSDGDVTAPTGPFGITAADGTIRLGGATGAVEHAFDVDTGGAGSISYRLVGDSDGDGVLVTDAGTVTLLSGGRFRFDPKAGYTGTAGFDYAVGDGSGVHVVETVSIDAGVIATDRRIGTGTALSDLMVGGNTGDRINGRTGNDALYGKAGNDTLVGGAGVDSLHGGTGDDELRGGNDSDSLSGGDGSDRLIAWEGDDTASGGSGADTITGAAGADRLFGDAGNDDLDGGDDNDHIEGGDGADVIDGGSGSDYLDGGADADSLVGGIGYDTLLGGAGADRLNAGGAADSLSGGAGDDYLSGGTGRDTLDGGTGNDELNGGAGYDSYAFGRGDGADSIRDSGGQDEVVFKAGIRHDQLWFARTAHNDLTVSVLGTADVLTVTGWFGAANPAPIETMTVAGGYDLTSAQVNALVTAMAAYAPPGSGVTDLSGYATGLQTTVNTLWGA